MPSNSLAQRLATSYRTACSHDYVERLCTSWLVSPGILFAIRLLIATYAFVVLFFQIGWACTRESCDSAGRSFSYFTVLTYWGLAFYYAIAALHTGVYAFRGVALLQNWPTVLKWLHSVFYSSITVFPFIVTAVYWSVLASGAFKSQYSTWSNLSQHGLNSLLAFLEIALPRSLPHPWIDAPLLVVILALYLALAYVSHATQGGYVYDFLDPAWHGRGAVAGACIGILAATMVVFVLVRYVIWLRKWITESKLGMTGKLTHRVAPGRMSSTWPTDARELGTVEKL